MAIRLVPLPFSTFGSIVDAGWAAQVYCPGCYRTVSLDIAEAMRPRIAFHARFRCQHVRYNGLRCDSLGHLQVLPPERIGPNAAIQHCELHCGGPIAWSIQDVRLGMLPFPAMFNTDRFRCPGCNGAVGWTWHGGSAIPGNAGYKSKG